MYFLLKYKKKIYKKYKVNIQAIMYGSASINFVFNFAIKEALRYNFFFQISLMTVMFKEKSTVHFLCIRVCKKKNTQRY